MLADFSLIYNANTNNAAAQVVLRSGHPQPTQSSLYGADIFTFLPAFLENVCLCSVCNSYFHRHFCFVVLMA